MISSSEATAAARRIKAGGTINATIRDADLLAGFVLAGQDTERPENEPRPLTMHDRAVVAGHADQMLEDGYIADADVLLDAVRCCGEFPECAHILAWTEEHDAAEGDEYP